MRLTWNRSGRTLPHPSTIGMAVPAAAVLATAMAWADTSATVPAGAVQAASGTKSYEVTAAEGSAAEDACWFCQVVGTPSVAGSISVTEQWGDISAVVRHAKSGSELTVVLSENQSLAVIREGVQVGFVIPASAASDLPAFSSGMQDLEVDPAWQLFARAMGDACLTDTLIPGSAEPSADCVAICVQQHPIPPGCDPANPTQGCCLAQASLDHCSSVCRCDGSSLPSACEAVAAARYLAAWMNCLGIESGAN